MTSKKLFFLAFSCLFLLTTQAQVTSPGGYDWRDSSVVPPSRMEQHFEFMNNQYNFPARPRSQWEVGVKVGAPRIGGDVDALFPGIGFGVHLRKSLGYVLSLRGEYTNGTARGVGSTFIAVPTILNPAWSQYPAGKLYYNYKTNVNEFSLQGLINLNNISFHKAAPKVLLHGIVGVGLMTYNVKVDALNGTTPYAFTAGMTRDQVKAMLDGSYETDAPTIGDKIKLVTTVGFGASFKVSNKVNVSLEDRITYGKSDMLDGVKYYYPIAGTPAITPQYDAYNFLSLGLNINLF